MSKKVGIITLIGNNNYGNRLQNYAVEKVIKKMGFEPMTLRNAYGLNDKMNIFKFSYKYTRFILSKIKQFIIKRKNKRLACFKEFDKNVNVTKKTYNIYSAKMTNCDYYLVGSDQVWKPTYGRLSDLDLLTFAPSEKRISIAASFGINSLPDKYNEKAKKELLKFKAISVREDAGKKIVEQLTNRKDIEVIIDPTMMLTGDEWDAVSKKPVQFEKVNKKRYILNYFLGDISEENKNAIDKFAKDNDLYVINLLDKNDIFYETGPSEFLYLEKNATLICTDSFHSSVFAILYNTPFVVFDRVDKKDNMNSRIETLLSTFNLKSRKFNKELNKKVLNCDYTEAYKILDKEKKKANKFLKRALDKE